MTTTKSKFIFRAGYVVIIVVSIYVYNLVDLSFNTGSQPPTPSPAVPQTDLPVVAKVTFSSSTQRQYLTSEFDIWQIDHANQTVTALLSPDQQLLLRQQNFPIRIAEAETRQLRQVSQPRFAQDTGIPGYSCYRTVEETFASLSQLAINFPTLVSWLDIGDSWQKATGDGGYDIQVVVITNQQLAGPKPKLFLLSAVHARELATAELATRFAEHLVTGYGKDADITWLLDYFEVHILPLANPDGRKQAENGVLWRKNVDNDDGCNTADSWGVDLNRNSTYKWHSCSGCSSGQACSIVYRGPAPSSEPETQAFENYVSALYPDQRGPLDTDIVPSDASGVFITLHSYGKLILFPWGWQAGPAPNDAQLETLGRKFGYYTNYTTCQSGEVGCIYPTDGTNDDWAYGDLGLAAYTFEVGTSFFQACSYFEETIVPENLPALIYAIKSAWRPYQTPAGPESVAVTITPNEITAGGIVTVTAIADDTRYNSNGWGNEPTQPISAIRYSINYPSWITGATTYPLTATDGLFDTSIEVGQALIDTTGWRQGRYQILVESQDAQGNWGVPSATFLSVKVRSILSTGPGQPAIHNLDLLSIINDVSYPETFTVTASPYDWDTVIPTTVGPIVVGTTHIPFPITVTPPLTATIGAEETISLTLTTLSTGSSLPLFTITTRVNSQLFLPVILRDVKD